MKKVTSRWLLAVLTLLFILCAALAVLDVSGKDTAYAAETVVGNDGRNLYPGDWTSNYMKSFASTKNTGSGSETLKHGTYSFSGAVKNSALNFQINSGATFSMTVTNMVDPGYIVYSRFMVGKTTDGSHNVTLTVSFGNKSDSVTFDTSTSVATYWYPDLKGGGGSSITWTLRNNSGSAFTLSNGYTDYYVAREYTVNFNREGGSGGPATTSVRHYFSYSGITAPTRSGYKFLGYFDAKSGGTKYFNANGSATKTAWDRAPDTSVLDPVQLYAQWEVAEQAVNVSAGTGVSGVYLSTSSSATSGSASGSKFNSGATVYAFATLQAGYKHKSSWTRVSGTEDTAGAKYRVGSQTVGTTTVNFGTYSADVITYTIGYDTKGGTHGSTHPTTYNVTTNSFTISDPTRTGYTFAGWTGTGLSSATKNLTIAKGSIGNRTYTATWTANKYNINYFDQGGDAFVATHQSGYKAQHTYDSVTTLDNPTRAGHTFLGWHKAEDCSDAVVTEIGGKEYLNAFNLYAKWTHNVLIAEGNGISDVYISTSSYDLVGVESGEEYENGTVVYGYAVLERGYNAPSTWLFINGKSNTEGATYRIGSGTVTQDGFDFGTVEALPNHYYVMFENGGYVVATYGEYLPTLSAQDIPVRAGYTFEGYYNTEHGVEGIKYYNGDGTGSRIWERLEVTTLYAHWEVTIYDIVYELNGGVAENIATYTYFDEDIAITDPTKTGYTFVGWTGTGLDEATKNVVIASGSEGNRTYTANFTPNGYKAIIGDGFVNVVYDAAMPTYDDVPEKVGYTFHGFFDEEDGEGTKYYNADGTSAHVWNKTCDAELYPYFVGNHYVVTVNGHEYDVVFGDDMPALNEEDLLSQTGYTFDGYYYEPEEGDPVKYYNGDGTSAHVMDIPDSVVLTPHFVIRQYKISFDSNGGSEVATIEQVFGSEVMAPADPSRAGYTFKGWFADEELTEEYEFTTMPAEDIEVYAKWEIIVYSVSYELNGGVVSGNITTYTVESEEIVLSNPTKVGYTFVGWTGTDLEDKTMSVAIPAGSVGDRSYVANFEINQYTITFDSNGGSEVSAITKDYNAEVAAPADPTKTGYNFSGWFTDEELTQAYAFTTMPAEDVALFAKWTAMQFTLTVGEAEITATYDALLPDYAVPERIGYTFHGCFDEENGEGVKYIDVDGKGCKIWDKTEGGELYPYWTINSYKVFITETSGTKAVYSALSPIATSGNESGTEYVHNTVVYGFAVIARGYTAPHDWILVKGVANTDGAIYYIGEATVFGADYDFSDHYDTEGIPNKCVAVFDGKRAEEVIFGQMLNDLTAEQIPTKDGFTFNGYAINGVKYFDKDGKCLCAWDIEGAGLLVSEWVGNPYKVTLGEDIIDVVYNSDMPALDVLPTKTGYTFDGAYDGNNVQYYKADGTSAHVWDKDEDAELTIAWKINQYTITFDSNGGSEVSAITKDYNSEVAAPNAPTKNGYTFAAWFIDEELTEEYVFDKMPAEEVELFAKWNAVEYSVSYELNGGEAGGNVTSYTIESEEITLNDPTKVGYTFVGWTGTDLEDKTMSVAIAAGSVGNRSYVANFEINQYTIAFNSKGGSEVSAITMDYNSEVVAPNAPTKNGYTFAAWFIDEELTEEYVFTTMPAEDVELFAKWNAVEYSVSYELNGGEAGGNVTSYTIESEEITLNDPAKVGYTFVGWTGTDLEDKTMNVAIAAGSVGDRNYVANFEINQYTITFDSNGGSEVSAITQDYNTEVAAPADPSKTGYNFAGWFADEELTEEYVFTTIPAEDVELFAKWSAVEYSVSYELNGGEATGNVTSYTIESEEIALSNPTKVGYTFVGWTGTDLEDKTMNVAIAAGSVGNRSYVANFEINQYTIAFNSNGGSEVSAITQDYNSEVVAPSAPTKNGYTFAAWFIDEELTEEYVFDKMPAEEVELFAKWNVVEYSVSYELNGGVVSGNITTYTVESEEIALSNPTKVGYTFVGWTGTDLEDKTMNVAIAAGSVGNRSYVANFEINQYTIAFNSKGGSEVSAITKDYNTEVAAPNAPTKNGYTFAAWFIDEELTEEYVFTTMPAEDIDLYAKWVISAGNVIDFINAIGDVEYTSESKELIDAANEAYECLDEDQKNLVSNYEDLVKANSDYDSVDNAVDTVEEIGDVEYAENFKEKLDEARGIYDALSEGQKRIFPEDTLKKLVDAEKAYEAMDKIAAMGAPDSSDGYRGKVKEASDAFDALKDDQKDLVTPSFVSDLEDAKAIVGVMDKIDAIGDVKYTEESKALIDEARKAYDELTSDQKVIFPADMTEKLVNAEKTYDAMDKIKGITEDDGVSGEKVTEARDAYDALSEEQKDLIPADVLEELIDGEKACEAIDMINALGAPENSVECKEKIAETRQAYNALTEEQKALVSASVVAELKNVESAFDVIEKVNAIGNVERNDESKALIANARAAYDELSEDQKKLVPTTVVETLESAEGSYAAAEKAANQKLTLTYVLICAFHIIGIIILIILLVKRRKNKKEGEKE